MIIITERARAKAIEITDVGVDKFLRLSACIDDSQTVSYEVSVDKREYSADTYIHIDELELVINRDSLCFMKDITLDYSESGGGFSVMKNSVKGLLKLNTSFVENQHIRIPCTNL